ncbi:uncharacterized protein scaf11 [Aplochiton taeniatus]
MLAANKQWEKRDTKGRGRFTAHQVDCSTVQNMTGSGNDGQAPAEGTESEDAERCPICLCVLEGRDLAMPNSCCHVFCLGCLLTWAELQAVPSCPVDRRTFDTVFKWGAAFECIQVPVKKKFCKPNPNCFYSNPEPGACWKNNHRKKLRRHKTKMTQDAKAKGLIRKCSDMDPFAMSRKKIRGSLCCSLFTTQYGSTVATVAQELVDPLWIPETVSSETVHKQCWRHITDCSGQLAAVPIPISGTSRNGFQPSPLDHSPFPSGSLSPFINSFTPLGSGHFVFQGQVCAVTSPKGSEKRGDTASGSRAPSKQTMSATSRRSTRNSKSQEQAPTQSPVSPPSHSSDSETSTSHSSKPSQAAPPAAKRGKQTTKRKLSGKRKATARKKAPSRFQSSPSESEKEEEANKEEDGDSDQRECVDEVSEGEKTCADFAASLHAEQPRSSPATGEHSPVPLAGTDSQENDEDMKKQPEENEGHNDDKDMHHWKVLQDNDCSGDSNLLVPFNLSNEPLDSHQTGDSGEDDNMKGPEDSIDLRNNNNVPTNKIESCPSPNSELDLSACSLLALSDMPTASIFNKSPDAPEKKAMDENSQDSMSRTKDNSPSKDETDSMPIDCDSPSSELSENQTTDTTNQDTRPTGSINPAAPCINMVSQESNLGGQEPGSFSGKEKIEENKNGKHRRSRFHSAATTWSPTRESQPESSQRSHSIERTQERDSSRTSSGNSFARSGEKEKEQERERDSSRRERSRERRSRRRSPSHSRSRSRSRSRREQRRGGPSPKRSASRDRSPWRKEAHRGVGDRSGQGWAPASDTQRNPPEHLRTRGAESTLENGSFPVTFSEISSNNPDWVMEKSCVDVDCRNRDSTHSGSSRLEDQRSGRPADAWTRTQSQTGRDGGSDQGRGAGQGGYRSYNQSAESGDNRWQPRNTFSGTANNSGSDAYSRFNENRGGRRKEMEPCESSLDRSGWSSASSWAVRRTLPADVQNYYSRRERGGGAGGWSRQEEEQPPAADPPKPEPVSLALGDVTLPVNVNVLEYPRNLSVSVQPSAAFVMPPQVPMHLHPAVPLIQGPAAVASQGLPPPPPPPPPMQHGSLVPTAHPDSRTTQKLQIQERAVNEVKTAIKPYYQKKDITKEEYKDIVRKAVEKVCHSKSGEVNSGKVAMLVKAYVDKYKHARKK